MFDGDSLDIQRRCDDVGFDGAARGSSKFQGASSPHCGPIVFLASRRHRITAASRYGRRRSHPLPGPRSDGFARQRKSRSGRLRQSTRCGWARGRSTHRALSGRRGGRCLALSPLVSKKAVHFGWGRLTHGGFVAMTPSHDSQPPPGLGRHDTAGQQAVCGKMAAGASKIWMRQIEYAARWIHTQPRRPLFVGGAPFVRHDSIQGLLRRPMPVPGWCQTVCRSFPRYRARRICVASRLGRCRQRLLTATSCLPQIRIVKAMEDPMRSLLCAIFVGLLICGGTAEAAKSSRTSHTAPRTPPSSLNCQGDKVVWVNTHSHVYHFEGDASFGTTRHGKFMCQQDADKAGFRQPKRHH